MSLIEICETLHARGYRLRNNTPLIRVKNKRREPNVGALSRGFHNWFYAGWVVVDNAWVSIPPKTVRGDWEPAVSTEDFEAALAILEKRNMSRSHRRKHFYLLQNLIWLEKTPDGEPLKLVCSTPNSGKKSGGVPYYCLRSSDWNFLCREIDQQIPQQLQEIQIDPVWVPQIREAYIADIASHFGPSFPDERTRLEAALKGIWDEEISSLRLRRKHQITRS